MVGIRARRSASCGARWRSCRDESSGAHTKGLLPDLGVARHWREELPKAPSGARVDTDQQGHITLHDLKFVALDDPAAEKSGNGGAAARRTSVASWDSGTAGRRRRRPRTPAPAMATPYAADVTAYAEAYEAGRARRTQKEYA